MKKTLYVSDLDGTLLHAEGVLSAYARETLNRMIDEGLLFTIATGRQLLSVQAILAGLNLRLPVIEKDGAFVSDLHTGEHYIRRDIRRETAVTILDTLLEAGQSPFINSTDGLIDKLCYNSSAMNRGSKFYLELRQSHGDPRLSEVDLKTAVLQNHTVGFIAIGKQDELDPILVQLLTQFPDELSGYVGAIHFHPGWYWLAIHHLDAQKSHGIRAMQQMCGLQDTEVVVFGDQVNDLPMFATADRAYAMQNAEDAVKEAATAVIDPNTSDSVVRFIAEEWEARGG